MNGLHVRGPLARLGIVALVLLFIGPTSQPVAHGAAAGSAPADAYLYFPVDGGRAVARWNGAAAGYTVAAARDLLPGQFDGVGGGVFVYRPGSALDGILRVRLVDGELQLSFRKEVVNGEFEPVAGDFDGNGLTDIFWNRPDGGKSYIWLFNPDGSHVSRLFDDGYTGTWRPARGVDVNLDGVSDLVWTDEAGELWVMRRDGSHIRRNIALFSYGGVSGFVAGNVGPADGVTRRRMVTIYEGGYEELLTFNSAGQSTSKVLRPHTGNCCKYQGAISGHFRSGYERTLFFYDGVFPQHTEYLQDVTPGGNSLITAAPQITTSYDTAVGDYDGNGFDDVLLSDRGGRTFLFSSDGTTFTKSDPPNIPVHSFVVTVPMKSPG